MQSPVSSAALVRTRTVRSGRWRIVTLLSVVIAALNSERTIGYTLSSVFSNSLSNKEFEVILVDNGSTDNTIEVAKKYPAKVFWCAKRGQGAARNLGIEKARGEIICFTDSDVIVPSNWLEKILEFFNTHPSADGVGGPVLAPSSGYVNNLQKLEGEIYARTHNFPSEVIESKLGEKRSSHYSANCAYRRDVITSSKGFDESGLDAVDIDLCWRLIMMKRRCIFDPEIRVTHLGFPWSLSGVFKQQFRWGKSQAILNMRYRVKTDLKGKIFPYYSLATSFLHILYSRDRTDSILQFFEKWAFNCGCLCARVF